MVGSADGRKDGLMDVWMDGWMGGWVDRWIDERDRDETIDSQTLRTASRLHKNDLQPLSIVIVIHHHAICTAISVYA